MANKTAMVRARMEPWRKSGAEDIFKGLGTNPTDAITMFYTQVILKKGMPFPVDLEEGDELGNYTVIESDEHLESELNV